MHRDRIEYERALFMAWKNAQLARDKHFPPFSKLIGKARTHILTGDKAAEAQAAFDALAKEMESGH